jgi:hypothetical protein
MSFNWGTMYFVQEACGRPAYAHILLFKPTRLAAPQELHRTWQQQRISLPRLVHAADTAANLSRVQHLLQQTRYNR